MRRVILLSTGGAQRAQIRRNGCGVAICKTTMQGEHSIADVGKVRLDGIAK